MTKRKIKLHAMKFIDKDSKNKEVSFQPQRGYLTKDRKIKLDKIIKGSGFKEI